MCILDNWWLTYYRAKKPNANERLNPLIIDVKRPQSYVPPLNAAIDAVNKIAQNFPPPYNLLVSGGVDSQCTILSWVKSGIPFKITHYSYNGQNAHDTETLLQFCEQNNLDVQIENFDVDNFLNSSEYIELAKKYDVASPHILTYIKLASLHEDTVVMSGNFITNTSGLSAGINYTILGLDRFRLISKSNFIPFFFLYTPELAFAFQDTDIKNQNDLIKRGMDDIIYANKCKTYIDSGFNVIPQKSKMTGFEKIKISYDTAHVPRALVIKYRLEKSKRPFDFLYRYALYDHIGRYNEYTLINIL